MWEIVLGELDEKMGVTVLEQSAERVVATMPVADGAVLAEDVLAGEVPAATGDVPSFFADQVNHPPSSHGH